MAGHADNTPAGIAATGRVSERDWLASPGRTADSYDPSYPLPSVDPLSWRWKPLYCMETTDIIPGFVSLDALCVHPTRYARQCLSDNPFKEVFRLIQFGRKFKSQKPTRNSAKVVS